MAVMSSCARDSLYSCAGKCLRQCRARAASRSWCSLSALLCRRSACARAARIAASSSLLSSSNASEILPSYMRCSAVCKRTMKCCKLFELYGWSGMCNAQSRSKRCCVLRATASACISPASTPPLCSVPPFPPSAVAGWGLACAPAGAQCSSSCAADLGWEPLLQLRRRPPPPALCR